MTREERKAKAAERLRKRQERHQRFPEARLDSCNDHYSVVVMLSAGDGTLLRILKRGEWGNSASFPGGWVEAFIHLYDPSQLGEFIAALVARYNAIIERMNTTASAAQIAKAEEIP